MLKLLLVLSLLSCDSLNPAPKPVPGKSITFLNKTHGRVTGTVNSCSDLSSFCVVCGIALEPPKYSKQTVRVVFRKYVGIRCAFESLIEE